MTSSMQARESLGSLSELFTPMLGEEAAAIGAHAPETSPEDKLAKDIKKVIAEESAKIRHTSMTEAKLKAEQFHTEHTLTWMPPEELENEVISAFVKAFRYDAIAKGTEGMTSWDTDRYYTSETIGIMPSQKENIDDLISKIRTLVTMEVANSVDKIMVELEADPALFNGPASAQAEASVRKSIDVATTETLSIAAAASTAANQAKMKEAALRVQHDLMVKRNTELHNLNQMCKAATDRITELTHLQREARNVRNALDRTDARFADVTEESKYDSIIERERAELKLQTDKRNLEEKGTTAAT